VGSSIYWAPIEMISRWNSGVLWAHGSRCPADFRVENEATGCGVAGLAAPIRQVLRRFNDGVPLFAALWAGIAANGQAGNVFGGPAGSFARETKVAGLCVLVKLWCFRRFPQRLSHFSLDELRRAYLLLLTRINYLHGIP